MTLRRVPQLLLSYVVWLTSRRRVPNGAKGEPIYSPPGRNGREEWRLQWGRRRCATLGRPGSPRAGFAVQAANIRLLIEVEERSKREARLTAELEELRRAAERAP